VVSNRERERERETKVVTVASRWWETSAWGQSFRAGGANHSQPYFLYALFPCNDPELVHCYIISLSTGYGHGNTILTRDKIYILIKETDKNMHIFIPAET